ncbi:hypothetical protein [Mycoplasmoides genitalium]
MIPTLTLHFDPQKVKEQSYFRIIADHFKAITFTISEGVLPGPTREKLCNKNDFQDVL